MGIMIIIIITALFAALTVYDIRRIRGRFRMPFRIVNAVLGAVILLAAVLFVYSETECEINSRDYDVSRSGLLGNANYTCTDGDYYIISSSGLFSSDAFAVPREQVKLPHITRLYSPVIILRVKADMRTEHGEERYTDKGYRIDWDVVRMIPDYFDLSVIMAVVSVLILVVFNLISFAVTIAANARNKNGEGL